MSADELAALERRATARARITVVGARGLPAPPEVPRDTAADEDAAVAAAASSSRGRKGAKHPAAAASETAPAAAGPTYGHRVVVRVDGVVVGATSLARCVVVEPPPLPRSPPDAVAAAVTMRTRAAPRAVVPPRWAETFAVDVPLHRTGVLSAFFQVGLFISLCLSCAR